MVETLKPQISRTVSSVILIALYIAIPLMIIFGIIPWGYKFVAMSLGGVFLYILLRLLGISNRQLGLTLHEWRESIRLVMPITVIFLGVAASYLAILGPRYRPDESLMFFIFYIFISCPMQEFLFRGGLRQVLIPYKLRAGIEKLVAATLFGYVHLIYLDLIVFVAMLGIGYGWYRSYLKAPNLLGVTISHIVLGVLTIALGLVN